METKIIEIHTNAYTERILTPKQDSEGLHIENKQLVWCDTEVGINRRIQRPDWKSSVETASKEQKSRDRLWGTVVLQAWGKDVVHKGSWNQISGSQISFYTSYILLHSISATFLMHDL